MFRLRFITVVRKNFKHSTNVFGATGTGKFNFSAKESIPSVSQCLTIVRYQSSEGCYYLLSELDKYVVPIHNRKSIYNPIATGWWTRVCSYIISDIFDDLTDKFWNNKVYIDNEFSKSLSSFIGFNHRNQLLENYYQYFKIKKFEAPKLFKSISTTIAENTKKALFQLLVNIQNGSNNEKETSPEAIENYKLIHEHNYFNITQLSICCTNFQQSDFVSHQNRIFYIQDQLKIPFEFLCKKLYALGLHLKNCNVDQDHLIKDELITDDSWIFCKKVADYQNISFNMKKWFPHQNYILTSEKENLKTSAVTADISDVIASNLNCDVKFIQKLFDNNILKEKVIKTMVPILRLLKGYGVTNKQIRHSIEILNSSPVKIQQRLKLLQDINCKNVPIPVLLLREKKFDLCFENLKTTGWTSKELGWVDQVP